MMTRSSFFPVCGVIDSARSTSFSRFRPWEVKFKGPGEDQRGEKADCQKDDDAARQPDRRVHHRQHRPCHLQDQPGTCHVEPGDAQDVTTFQFVDEGHWPVAYLVSCGQASKLIPRLLTRPIRRTQSRRARVPVMRQGQEIFQTCGVAFVTHMSDFVAPNGPNAMGRRGAGESCALPATHRPPPSVPRRPRAYGARVAAGRRAAPRWR